MYVEYEQYDSAYDDDNNENPIFGYVDIGSSSIGPSTHLSHKTALAYMPYTDMDCLSVIVTTTPPVVFYQPWYPDGRATTHMTNNPVNFTKYDSTYDDDDNENPSFRSEDMGSCSIRPSTHLSYKTALAYMSYTDHGLFECYQFEPHPHYPDLSFSSPSKSSLASTSASNIIQSNVASVTTTLSVVSDQAWHLNSGATT
ncbi:hypothetical protein GOBAR_DD34211 [Gossypium barbadense]|nr:hypothetical protein GOBAR_DD34211 [Gossypium barbadense]